MFKKFPIGTKLKAVDNNTYGPLVRNSIYTVSGYNQYLVNSDEPAYLLEEFPKNDTGFFAYRFYPVTENKPFNVSTATDQELADEYRRLRAEQKPLFRELSKRGYSIDYGNGVTNHFGEYCKIIKKATVEL